MKYIKKLILKLTHRIWYKEILRLFKDAHKKKLLNNAELHELECWFNPDHKHKIY